jgi:DNA primase catalytic core
MPRYPDELITRLKREASIVTWLEQTRGTEFQPHGQGEVVCRCPLPGHEDRTPSFCVSLAKNVWQCLGACGTGGNVIDLVMAINGCDFRAAVETLLAAFPSLASYQGTSEPRKTGEPLLLPDMSDDELARAVVQYYHDRLQAVPEALRYWQQRGISQEAITHFKLGVADRTLGLRIPAKQNRIGGALRERLQALGFFRKSGHETFTGRVMVPITDASGIIKQVYGRRYTEGTVPHLYRAGPHDGVFNVAGIAAANPEKNGGGWCVLCESLIDALTVWSAGFESVTTAYGTNNFTAATLETLQAQNVRDVLIAFDRDTAGDQAAATVAEQLQAVGINAWRVLFPHGMDANAYVMSTQPAEKVLGIALRSAKWLGDGPAPSSPLDRRDDEKSAKVNGSDSSLAINSGNDKEIKIGESAPVAPASADAAATAPLAVIDGGTTWTADNRTYRLQGLGKFKLGESGRITVALQCPGGQAIDTVDLYQRKARQAFAQAAHEDANADKNQVQRDLAALLAALETWAVKEAAQHSKDGKPDPVATMPAAERAAAEALLRDPDLVERSVRDLERCGLIGESTNKLVGLVALVSRKMQRPLALLIQSLSGAGKTTLMEGLLAFLPDEERVQYSAMTGRSVFYLGDSDLRHKVLALVEEEGAQQAAYALKLLQSEGKLTIASTGKDPQSGRMVTHDYTVEGPVMLMLTTTAAEIDDELQNRCLVVGVDEAREQTQAVHAVQRLRCTLSGLLRDTDKKQLTTLHQNAQRLLQPLPVVNPYAEHLTFPDHQTRLRRDHAKYLGLIEAITLWHQFQRPLKAVQHDGQRIEYIETTLADIELANRIAHQVLGRSVDELAPQTRRLLIVTRQMVGDLAAEEGSERRQVRFTRRQLRDFCGWGDTQLKVHTSRLVNLEFFIAHREKHRQMIRYELAWDGDPKDSTPQFGGLINPVELERTHA